MRGQNHNERFLLKKISRSAGPGKRSPRFPSLSLGIGDDAALFRPKAGYETILTCDWFLEGTHFLRDKHPPDSVGWKCLARAVSDVAAMGGSPRYFLMSLALPDVLTGRWLSLFLGGSRRASRKFGCVLVGGDTTQRDDVLINVTAVGEVAPGQAVRRSGAKSGDLIYVSGRLGEAEMGLQALRRSEGSRRTANAYLRKHLYPKPRLELGQWLAKKGLATAMMDLSDGLSSDLPRLCAASGVGGEVEAAKLPVPQVSNADRKRGIEPLHLALHGGDDYELLFTAMPSKSRLLPRIFRGVTLTPIGTMTEKPELLLLEKNGRQCRLVPGGWDPFRTAH
ncbi:MAG TPA: thiamine-phosphate kinase [Candidatus Acidoferrum sp.]|nr:thiamine-phosphate kinase [Candidatus Acidoferrum sp.]